MSREKIRLTKQYSDVLTDDLQHAARIAAKAHRVLLETPYGSPESLTPVEIYDEDDTAYPPTAKELAFLGLKKVNSAKTRTIYWLETTEGLSRHGGKTRWCEWPGHCIQTLTGQDDSGEPQLRCRAFNLKRGSYADGMTPYNTLTHVIPLDTEGPRESGVIIPRGAIRPFSQYIEELQLMAGAVGTRLGSDAQEVFDTLQTIVPLPTANQPASPSDLNIFRIYPSP